MKETQSIVGTRFGRWTVIDNAPTIRRSNGKSDRAVLCRCDCGVERILKKSDLLQGSTKSCGCYRSAYMRSRQTTHGMTNTRIFAIWDGMNGRCKRNTIWNRNYAGRGISVCEEWRGKQGFEKFYKWAMEHGYDDSLTLDRIDVNSDYCPDNCRWVDMITQGNNRRTNRKITYRGRTQTLTQWSRETGINVRTLYSRLFQLGWTTEKALEV